MELHHCHMICCFGRKHPNGYLYVEVSSEQFLISSNSTPQNGIVQLDSLILMYKNKGYFFETSLLIQLTLPPSHFWRIMPNTALCRRLYSLTRSSAQPLFTLPLFLVHAGTTISTLVSVVACPLSQPRTYSAPHCWWHLVLWNVSETEENHFSPFVRTLRL